MKTRRKKNASRKGSVRITPTASADHSEYDPSTGSGTWVGAAIPWLWLRPLQTPVDENFAPYHARAMRGDLEALVDFYRECGPDIGTAFFECIGYLAAVGGAPERAIIRKILGIQQRGGPSQTTAAKINSARDWVNRLGPIAQEAKKWMSEQRAVAARTGQLQLTREKLWGKWLSEKLVGTSKEDFDTLLKEIDFLWDVPLGQDPHETFTAGEYRRPRGPRPRGRHILQHIVQDYLSRGVVPRELFFQLARTKPSLPPSVAVRRFAAKLAEVSESRLSRKTLRKK